MTEKQHNFIKALLNERDYDYNDSSVQAFRSGLDLTTSQASDLIGYLLGCEKLATAEPSIKAIENALYKVIKNKKTPKNAEKHRMVKDVIGRYLTKGDYYNLTEEEFKSIAHIVL